jgi:hypothetical protein
MSSRNYLAGAVWVVLAGTVTVAAQAPSGMTREQHLEHQGGLVMGFDQKVTTHHFILTATGGAIEVTVKDKADDKNVLLIRTHLKEIARQFAAGDFDKPLMTHGEPPDGVAEMTALRTAIIYTFEELPDGGRVRLVSTEPAAQDAVHRFLRYQIREHKTGDPLTIRK